MDTSTFLNNRYQLIEHIGIGGTTDRFLARDMLLERSITVQVLHKTYSDDKAIQNRFRQEARAVANLSHPNIVTVYDFGFDHDQLFTVMEYIPGNDLKTLLAQRGRYSVEDAIPLMVQACAGIGYAHRAGLVHCDVKPHNLLVTPDGRLKVAGFGIARALATIMPDEHLDVAWGTPQYFSPEQAAGKAPSPASDVYSLGIVLYEMFTGVLPFTAPTIKELARLHLEVDPAPLHEYIPNIPSALEKIILKVLSKEPAERYNTGDQLGRVLLRFGTQRDSPPAKLIENRKLKVFLCHSKDDKPQVRELYRRLVGDGFDAWLDEEKLMPGQEWDLEIRKAVRESDAVAVCLSKGSITKEGYVQKEIRFALDIADEKPEGAIFIIPARLEDCQVPTRLNKWQWVNLFDEKGYDQLKNSLVSRANTLVLQKASS